MAARHGLALWAVTVGSHGMAWLHHLYSVSLSLPLSNTILSLSLLNIIIIIVSPTPKYHPPHGFPKTNWASDTLQSALPRAQLSRMSRRAVLSSATNPLHINLRPRASLTPLKRHSMLEYRVSFLREIYLVSHS